MTVDLVPLREFSDRYARGWRIVPGYDLKASDYCATMMSPDHRLVTANNKSIASLSRQSFAGKRKAEVAA